MITITPVIEPRFQLCYSKLDPNQDELRFVIELAKCLSTVLRLTYCAAITVYYQKIITYAMLQIEACDKVKKIWGDDLRRHIYFFIQRDLKNYCYLVLNSVYVKMPISSI